MLLRDYAVDSTGVLAKEGCTEDARCFNIAGVSQRIPLFQNPWQGVQTVGGSVGRIYFILNGAAQNPR